MPILTWSDKKLIVPEPAQLLTSNFVYPRGEGIGQKAENRLIMGDNLAIMAALLPEYEGRINLIYIDPPFFSKKNYRARIGRGEDSRDPGKWQMAAGYLDNWKSLDAYLSFLYPRLALMYRLLAPNGTLYLHLDWHADAYARVLLDEFFGAENLLNEIIWTYHGPSPIKRAFNRKHDTILSYFKGKDYTFNVDDIREPYHPNTIKTFKSSKKAGFGKEPNLKRGKVPEDWWYFPVVARLHSERTGYPTQKPQALLERIIKASSNEGDIVADFFSGSGTTALVAGQLGRKFIATDATWRAIHTSSSRLTVKQASPFSIEHDSVTPPPRLSPVRFAHLEGDAVLLDMENVPELDYWEIDSAWDGEMFKSVAQVLRPVRSGALLTRIPLPEDVGREICVRGVGVNGERYQTVLKR